MLGGLGKAVFLCSFCVISRPHVVSSHLEFRLDLWSRYQRIKLKVERDMYLTLMRGGLSGRWHLFHTQAE